MPDLRIKVDGETIFKGGLGDWATNPPDAFTAAIKAGARPEPWMKGILVAMGDAVAANVSTRITVRTFADGWSMEVHSG